MMNILEKIIEQKRHDVAKAKNLVSVSELQDRAYFTRQTFSLAESVKKNSGIIAEFKRQSPSKGVINAHSQVLEVAEAYQNYGASGISILTDKQFFGGSMEDIKTVREQTGIPILRKDFMIDAYQFYEAKAGGADAVLLIAAVLSPAQVQEFTVLSHELGLEVLLEIHTEAELQHFHSEVDLVGINNRNLKNFKVDLQHSIKLRKMLPANVLCVAESGIYSVANFQHLRSHQFDGFLMGEFFMRHENVGEAFAEFIKECD